MSADVAFVTMSLARTPDEGELLVAALRRLAAHGSPVMVTDGGSSREVVDALRGADGIQLGSPRDGRGLIAQIRTSFAEAARLGARQLVYTEPDKLQFFEQGIDFLVDAARRAPADALLLAARTPEAFDTFPAAQREYETRINVLTGNAVGVAGDYSYGPFVMPASLVPLVVELDTDDLGWGWRHFLFAAAHRRGHVVAHHSGPFECPLDQREEDEQERAHRVRQFEQNVRGLHLGLAVDRAGTGPHPAD